VGREGTGHLPWGLYPVDEGTTRLVTRVRIRYNWKSPQVCSSSLDAYDIV
jgi:hypothetical protein